MSQEVNRKNKNKFLGQFFTPERVAGFLVDWILGAERIASQGNLKRILDPAIGNGIFFESVLDKCPNLDAEWVGFDLDTQCLSASRSALENRISKASILSFYDQDFLLQKENQKFDAILCNPPYRKISDKNYSRELIQQFEGKSDRKLPGTANLYVFFLLKCLNLINVGGRAAFLVPQDFFNSGYGVFIKFALQESGLLHSLFLFSPQDSLFDEAITSSCILLLENSEKEKKSGFYWTRLKPGFFSDTSKLPLSSVESIQTDWISFPDPEEKWSPIFHRLEKKTHTGEKKTDFEKKEFDHFVPLTEFGKFTRGIATGDNNFFLFTKEMVEVSGIPEKYFKACIPKSQYARNKIFLHSDWEELSRKGAKVWLLDVKLEFDPKDSLALQNHLQSGITRGVHQRFLPSRRKNWYTQESKSACPILASSFHRTEIRIVRNFSNVVHLTCFHGFNPVSNMEEWVDALYAYLISSVSKKDLEARRREYARGLWKAEPGDLNSLWVPDFRRFDSQIQKELRTLVFDLKEARFSSERENFILHRIDSIFKEGLL
ncbi:N-6 DNA methylase [Leptospira santarosai]|uniref:Eco57I restriction-modification methylase n=1 Tax=Leptospira santarosai serovar Arenal str. MAVJ 401 TaxID=1049976 RepID=M6K6E5_9LEPT|nr:N-6 DNA methylase [Leptospira santarosai]EMM78905.1 Eco57I restriction-modification methylase [Leptospira santarosai str. 2000030832]EMN23287.1 Eco57I restriction-modification methylase [Leptospira santarosai serovar Arenal str. MAVJ 401]MDI7188588.1 N-6 DNA methylase [Leptospira santarosai]MDI7211246.1 N-6 DNA methylase [Leptospira santarosai]MDI7215011.1 N-6 DNA methylase [Leptospira santarosai]